GHPLGPSVVEAHPPAARGARTLGRESPRRRSSRPPRSSPALGVPSPTVCASAPGGRPGEHLWRPGAGPPQRLSVEWRATRLEMLAILHQNRRQLLRKPNVVGCGVGWKQRQGRSTGEQALCVYVEQKVPPSQLGAQAIIPRQVGPVPTDVIEVGRMRTLALRTHRLRPAPGGVSIGHYRVTAGTLGAVVKDRKTSEWLVLSNNHVLANGTDGRDGRAQGGDPILRPGPHDGGDLERDRFGSLARFIPLRQPPRRTPWGRWLLGGGPGDAPPQKANRVDAALAKPDDPADLSPEIMGVGRLQGVARAEPGLQVMKSGRTTALTSGEVQAVHVTMVVYLSDAE